MKKTLVWLIGTLSLLLGGCGGGGGGGGGVPGSPPPAVSASLSYAPVKGLHFAWNDVDGATHYRLLEDPDGGSGYVQVGNDIPAGDGAYAHTVPLHKRATARYIVQSCNAGGCSDSDPLYVDTAALATAIGYFKAGNTGENDRFGAAVALSADGTTLAVGAPSEDSDGSNLNDDSSPDSGAVYVFVRDGDGWSQQAYVKASNTDQFDQFGYSVALSADGGVLAVGAPVEVSEQQYFGAAYVFVRSGGAWTQQAHLTADQFSPNAWYGAAVALSADGATLAVGEPWGPSPDNDPGTGAVHVFVQEGGNWTLQAHLGPQNDQIEAGFGYAVALSDDGATLAVSAPTTYINGLRSGVAYVFTRNDVGFWSQEDMLGSDNPENLRAFGEAVALSGDGAILAVGAPGEDGSGDDSGAVHVFARTGGAWSPTAHLQAPNADAGDRFGTAVALSADGTTLAVGAPDEDSPAAGIDGNQGNFLNSNAADIGAVYVFTGGQGGQSWSQTAYVKAANPFIGDRFGTALALSGDGDALAVAATGEDSAATGVGGDQNDNTAQDSGAVYLY